MMMTSIKRTIHILFLICLSGGFGGLQAQDSGDSLTNPPPDKEQSSEMPPSEELSPPPSMPEPPPSEVSPPNSGVRIPSPPRKRHNTSKLDEQERELLQKHNENALRARKKSAAKVSPATKKANSALSNLSQSPVTGALTLDFVDEPILDVLRAIATSYKLSIIPDKDIGDVKVTIHLENIPVMEGLDKLCSSHGLDLIEDGSVLRIRKASENTVSVLEMQSKRMNIRVQNKPVKDFIREFTESTRINIVPDHALQGMVTGNLKDVLPVNGFKAIMAANNYNVRLKNGVYLVENGEATPGDPNTYRRGRRPGAYGSSGSPAEIDVQGGKVNLSLHNAALGDAVRELAEQSGLNMVIYGEITGNVNAELKGVTVDAALMALMQGTRYTFMRKNGILAIGDRNPNTPSGQALSGVELYYLKHMKVENIEKLFPKSIPKEGIVPLKEQNAVLINGTSEDITLIKDYLNTIDLPVPQVLMEVMVVEYNRSSGSDFGIVAGNSQSKPDPVTAGPVIDAVLNTSGLRGAFTSGIFRGGISILPQNFDLSLRALESKDKAKILSMPKITTLNGNKAELRVNRTSYYQVSSVTKDGFQNNDFRSFDDGITIELTPWVTKHGEVNVTVTPSIKTSSQGSGDGPTPITDRRISTNVKLMDGETIALGGLINSQEDKGRKFVPILGSIPILGYLFSYSKTLRRTTELVIYITPHILPNSGVGVDLAEEMEKLDDRGGFIKNSDFLRKRKDAPSPSLELDHDDPDKLSNQKQDEGKKGKAGAIPTPGSGDSLQQDKVGKPQRSPSSPVRPTDQDSQPPSPRP